jgi:hypothetical protein
MTLAVQGGTVTARDLAAAQDVAQLQHGQPITGALLNSDGLKAATYSKNGDFWLWQATPLLEAQAAQAIPVEEPKPTPFAKVEEEAATKEEANSENVREQPLREAEREPKKRKGAFRRFFGIFH